MENFDLNQQQPQITSEMIRQSKTHECAECGNKVFVEAIVLKKLSSLVTGTGKEELMPARVMVCRNCGKVPKEIDHENIIDEDLKV